MKLRCLDVFTGIGGFGLALKDVVCPVAYCDIDPLARRVVQKKLPKALWIDDVRDLARGPNTGIGGFAPVDIICAGFPCTGFSQSGKRNGFEDPQSGLFFDLVRVIKKFQPEIVFLENVPLVIRNMPDVHDRLNGMGYDLRWCVLPALAVGSPMIRRRWFCLATKRSKKIALPPVRMGEVNSWKSRDFGSAKTCGDPLAKQRCSLLGNSVVPGLARYAFFLLCSSMERGPTTSDALIFKPISRGSLRPYGDLPKIDMGYTMGSKVYAMPPIPEYAPPPVNVRLRMSNWDRKGGERVIVKRYWTGPRHGCVHGCNSLNDRISRDLGSQARYCDEPFSKGPYLNPNFAEWLMGFPRDWTKVL